MKQISREVISRKFVYKIVHNKLLVFWVRSFWCSKFFDDLRLVSQSFLKVFSGIVKLKNAKKNTHNIGKKCAYKFFARSLI